MNRLAIFTVKRAALLTPGRSFNLIAAAGQVGP
jgi:hypothetical protein